MTHKKELTLAEQPTLGARLADAQLWRCGVVRGRQVKSSDWAEHVIGSTRE